MRSIQIELGALSSKINQQLKDANIICNKNEIELCQKDADAITRLILRGFISDSSGQTARKKLIKNIEKIINQESK